MKRSIGDMRDIESNICTESCPGEEESVAKLMTFEEIKQIIILERLPRP